MLLAITSISKFISGKRLVFQFPPKVEVIPSILIAQWLGIKPIAIVHDLDYLRKIENFGLRCILDPKGFRMLRHSAVIIHPGGMWNLLVENGITPKANINFWPHIITNQVSSKNKISPATEVSPTLLYAGNLVQEKCRFLKDLKKLQRPVSLYGESNFEITGEQISIHPPFKEDKPPELLVPALGLVWDGDSIEGLQGNYGEYQKLNLPAKLSLYLAMGIPVVVSVESNISKFVNDSGIGISVNNLYEIPLTFSSEVWNSYLEKSSTIGKKVLDGQDFIAAFETISSIQ